MNPLDKQYHDLLRILLHYGIDKRDRTGTGTKSIFGYQIRHNMAEGFPLLTTKKMAVKTMMTELKWFLKGRTDIQYLRDNNCKIWDGDYEKSGRTDGQLGPIYGKQWRDWDGNDQLQNLIKQLKTNPDSRRLIVSAWNVGELKEMVLPPCHYGFQVYTSADKAGVRYLSLMWNQRSVDTFLGLPFNIASYGTLLLLLASEAGMIPGHLIGSLGDVHLYNNHIEQAYEQLGRAAFKLPDIRIDNVDILNGEFDYQILRYKSHSPIKAPLSN
jgi:thymidylate synthase